MCFFSRSCLNSENELRQKNKTTLITKTGREASMGPSIENINDYLICILYISIDSFMYFFMANGKSVTLSQVACPYDKIQQKYQKIQIKRFTC